MSWNDAAITLAANALRAAGLYGQLHTAAAGGSYTSNVSSAARVSMPWTTVTGRGNFGLSTPMIFTGGTPGGPIYSLTVWSAPTGGTCYGEFLLTGDVTFNAAGGYNVTALDFAGSST